jgi:hypothetical protein
VCGLPAAATGLPDAVDNIKAGIMQESHVGVSLGLRATLEAAFDDPTGLCHVEPVALSISR